jgi:hypothetical protein
MKEETVEQTGDGRDDDGPLDSRHQELIQRVLDKDTRDARGELAAQLSGVLIDEEHALKSEQKDIGSQEQMAAIRGTGWTAWAGFFVIASWVIVVIDSIIWFFGGARVLNLGQ